MLLDRDKDIVRTIYAYRMLTREQVQRLLFSSVSAVVCRRRLRMLFDSGYLSRFLIPTASGALTWKPVYRLAKQGAILIATERGITAGELPFWSKDTATVSSGYVEHTLETNDFRITVQLALKARTYELRQWLDDTALKSKERREYVKLKRDAGKEIKKPLIPDGYFTFKWDKFVFHGFVELDRSTIPLARWKEKMQLYQAYYDSKAFEQRYNAKFVRILTITPSLARAQHLKTVAENTNTAKMFYFACKHDITPETLLFSPIWLVPSTPEPQPLIAV